MGGSATHVNTSPPGHMSDCSRRRTLPEASATTSPSSPSSPSSPPPSAANAISPLSAVYKMAARVVMMARL